MNGVHIWNVSMQHFGFQKSGSRSSGAKSDVFGNGGMHCFLNGLLPQEGGSEVCWCRQCRQSHVPGPYGWRPEQPAHQARSVVRTAGLPGAGFADGVAEMNSLGFTMHAVASTVPATSLSKTVWAGVNSDSNFVHDGFTSIGLRVGLAGWS